jgi:hypothetical protein
MKSVNDVSAHLLTMSPVRTQLVCQDWMRIDATRTQHDTCALRGEKPGGRLAQPAARACDDDDFPSILLFMFIVGLPFNLQKVLCP